MTEENLVKKLAEAMAEVGYVQKDATNDFHKYTYASAAAVLKKVNAALSKRQIAVATQAELLRYENNHAVVKISLTFTDGTDSLTAEGIGEGSDKGDKSVMKANTAATKYALADAFMISWGDDPEADPTTDSEADSKKEIPSSTSPRVGTGEEQTSPSPANASRRAYPNLALPALNEAGMASIGSLLERAEQLGWSLEKFTAWRMDTVHVNEFSNINASQAMLLLQRLKTYKEDPDE